MWIVLVSFGSLFLIGLYKLLFNRVNQSSIAEASPDKERIFTISSATPDQAPIPDIQIISPPESPKYSYSPKTSIDATQISLVESYDTIVTTTADEIETDKIWSISTNDDQIVVTETQGSNVSLAEELAMANESPVNAPVVVETVNEIVNYTKKSRSSSPVSEQPVTEHPITEPPVVNSTQNVNVQSTPFINEFSPFMNETTTFTTTIETVNELAPQGKTRTPSPVSTNPFITEVTPKSRDSSPVKFDLTSDLMNPSEWTISAEELAPNEPKTETEIVSIILDSTQPEPETTVPFLDSSKITGIDPEPNTNEIVKKTDLAGFLECSETLSEIENTLKRLETQISRVETSETSWNVEATDSFDDTRLVGDTFPGNGTEILKSETLLDFSEEKTTETEILPKTKHIENILAALDKPMLTPEILDHPETLKPPAKSLLSSTLLVGVPDVKDVIVESTEIPEIKKFELPPLIETEIQVPETQEIQEAESPVKVELPSLKFTSFTRFSTSPSRSIPELSPEKQLDDLLTELNFSSKTYENQEQSEMPENVTSSNELIEAKIEEQIVVASVPQAEPTVPILEIISNEISQIMDSSAPLKIMDVSVPQKTLDEEVEQFMSPNILVDESLISMRDRSMAQVEESIAYVSVPQQETIMSASVPTEFSAPDEIKQLESVTNEEQLITSPQLEIEGQDIISSHTVPSQVNGLTVNIQSTSVQNEEKIELPQIQNIAETKIEIIPTETVHQSKENEISTAVAVPSSNNSQKEIIMSATVHSEVMNVAIEDEVEGSIQNVAESKVEIIPTESVHISKENEMVTAMSVPSDNDGKNEIITSATVHSEVLNVAKEGEIEGSVRNIAESKIEIYPTESVHEHKEKEMVTAVSVPSDHDGKEEIITSATVHSEVMNVAIEDEIEGSVRNIAENKIEIIPSESVYQGKENEISTAVAVPSSNNVKKQIILLATVHSEVMNVAVEDEIEGSIQNVAESKIEIIPTESVHVNKENEIVTAMGIPSSNDSQKEIIMSATVHSEVMNVAKEDEIEGSVRNIAENKIEIIPTESVHQHKESDISTAVGVPSDHDSKKEIITSATVHAEVFNVAKENEENIRNIAESKIEIIPSESVHHSKENEISTAVAVPSSNDSQKEIIMSGTVLSEVMNVAIEDVIEGSVRNIAENKIEIIPTETVHQSKENEIITAVSVPSDHDSKEEIISTATVHSEALNVAKENEIMLTQNESDSSEISSEDNVEENISSDSVQDEFARSVVENVEKIISDTIHDVLLETEVNEVHLTSEFESTIPVEEKLSLSGSVQPVETNVATLSETVVIQANVVSKSVPQEEEKTILSPIVENEEEFFVTERTSVDSELNVKEEIIPSYTVSMQNDSEIPKLETNPFKERHSITTMLSDIKINLETNGSEVSEKSHESSKVPDLVSNVTGYGLESPKTTLASENGIEKSTETPENGLEKTVKSPETTLAPENGIEKMVNSPETTLAPENGLEKATITNGSMETAPEPKTENGDTCLKSETNNNLNITELAELVNSVINEASEMIECTSGNPTETDKLLFLNYNPEEMNISSEKTLNIMGEIQPEVRMFDLPCAELLSPKFGAKLKKIRSENSQ